MARCDQVLARLALTAGDPGEAVNRAAAPAAGFRDGEYLLELAQTLAVLADAARAAGDLEVAHRHAPRRATWPARMAYKDGASTPILAARYHGKGTLLRILREHGVKLRRGQA